MIEVVSEAAMKSFGNRVGVQLRGGEIIELIGDLGAGKTTFVKGVGQGLGIDEPIQSPSFTISRVYDARDGLTLAHYDFYRLNDAGIMADELAETMADPKTITIIEWGDIVDTVLPAHHMRMVIRASSEDVRDVEVTVPPDYSYLEATFK